MKETQDISATKTHLVIVDPLHHAVPTGSAHISLPISVVWETSSCGRLVNV